MPPLAIPQKDIDRARDGHIPTVMVERLRAIGLDALQGRATPEGADLLLICFPRLCEEVLASRQRAREGCEVDTSNVLPFPGDL